MMVVGRQTSRGRRFLAVGEEHFPTSSLGRRNVQSSYTLVPWQEVLLNDRLQWTYFYVKLQLDCIHSPQVAQS